MMHVAWTNSQGQRCSMMVNEIEIRAGDGGCIDDVKIRPLGDRGVVIEPISPACGLAVRPFNRAAITLMVD